jgi:hypothetical protein
VHTCAAAVEGRSVRAARNRKVGTAVATLPRCLPRHSAATVSGEPILVVMHVPHSPVAPPGSCKRTPCALPGSTIAARKIEVTISPEPEHGKTRVFGGLVDAMSSAVRTSALKQHISTAALVGTHLRTLVSGRGRGRQAGRAYRYHRMPSVGNLVRSKHRTPDR